MARILVVEDDPSTQLLIVSALEKEGHAVRTCDNGQRALDLLLGGDVPELLVSDVNLPGKDGYALVKELREHPATETLPIILLSSLAQRANVRVGMTTGADDYITKPFSLGELRESVQTQLRKKSVIAGNLDAAVQRAIDGLKDEISAQYEAKLHETVNKMWEERDSTWGKEGMDAAVLYVGMKHYFRYCEALAPDQFHAFLERYCQTMLDAVQLFGASSVKFYGEGLLAVFTPEFDSASVNKEMRVWRAALAALDAANRLKVSFDPKLAKLGLPHFEVCASLHTGVVQMMPVEGMNERSASTVPVGDAVNVVRGLYKKMSPVWRITASPVIAHKLQQLVQVKNHGVVNLPPRLNSCNACELWPAGDGGA